MKARWSLLTLSLIMTALLLSLGFWQLRRLEQKEALIAAIDQRTTSTAVDLPTGDVEPLPEYLKIRLTGQFLEQPVLRKLTSHKGRPGYDIIQPFLTRDNRLILVHRGSVPENFSEPLAQVSEMEAIIRLHDRGQGMFDPENDVQNGMFYWWGVPEMLGAIPNPQAYETLPFIAQQLPSLGATSQLPEPLTPKADLRNNHLGYAITWFGLAAVTVVMGVLAVFSRRKPVLNP